MVVVIWPRAADTNMRIVPSCRENISSGIKEMCALWQSHCAVVAQAGCRSWTYIAGAVVESGIKVNPRETTVWVFAVNWSPIAGTVSKNHQSYTNCLVIDAEMMVEREKKSLVLLVPINYDAKTSSAKINVEAKRVVITRGGKNIPLNNEWSECWKGLS